MGMTSIYLDDELHKRVAETGLKLRAILIRGLNEYDREREGRGYAQMETQITKMGKMLTTLSERVFQLEGEK